MSVASSRSLNRHPRRMGLEPVMSPAKTAEVRACCRAFGPGITVVDIAEGRSSGARGKPAGSRLPRAGAWSPAPGKPTPSWSNSALHCSEVIGTPSTSATSDRDSRSPEPQRCTGIGTRSVMFAVMAGRLVSRVEGSDHSGGWRGAGRSVARHHPSSSSGHRCPRRRGTPRPVDRADQTSTRPSRPRSDTRTHPTRVRRGRSAPELPAHRCG